MNSQPGHWMRDMHVLDVVVVENQTALLVDWVRPSTQSGITPLILSIVVINQL